MPGADRLSVAKRLSDPRYPWHAAFLSTNLGNGAVPTGAYVHIDFQIENCGAGILEIGVVTRNDTARLAALHWPGLQGTAAFTYACTGQRFWNVPGASEELWCRSYGEPYGAGDVVSLELAGGTLGFLRNGRHQGVLREGLAEPVYVGATLTDGGRLRLLACAVPLLRPRGEVEEFCQYHPRVAHRNLQAA